jgi:hypothetical protein
MAVGRYFFVSFQRAARGAATDVNSDALPAGSRLNKNWLCGKYRFYFGAAPKRKNPT